MADYTRYFQAVLRPASDHILEDFFTLSGRYANFRKETCFLRYVARGRYGDVIRRLDMWQGAGRGYVFAPELPRQPDRDELEGYLDLYGRGELPFRFENAILEEAFEDKYRQALDMFRRSRGRAEASIVRNFAVKLLFWIDRYFPRLFADTGKIGCSPKFACSGTVRLPEYLFLWLLYEMGCDVLCVGRDQDVCVTDPALLGLSVAAQAPEREPRPAAAVRPAPSRPRESVPPPVASNPSVRRTAPTAPPPSGTGKGEGQPLSYVELAKMASSVVMLKVFDGQNQCFKTGSGVIISSAGYILTNFHVAAGGRYYGVLLEEEPEACYTDQLIKYNQDLDLAVLRVEKGRRPIPLRRGGPPPVRGEKVVAIGSPLGLFNTVSDGIISGFRQVGERPMIQFTAPTSHGSSGGALLDLYGRLIGIITAGFDDGQNLNLAVDYRAILDFTRGLL